MDKDKKPAGSNQPKGEKFESNQKGAPSTSNNETGGNNRHERDNSSGHLDEKNTTKKQSNAV